MTGDHGTERREALVRDNLELAYDHARRLYGSRAGRGGLELEDFEQEAVLGLMAAADQYDPVTFPEIPFSAFARQYILRHISDQVRLWKKCQADPLSVDMPAPSDDPGRDRLALEIWDMLEAIPIRPREVLVRRYGLDGEPPLGLIGLSDHFGVPTRTVGRLLAMGRSIIRRECKARGFNFDRWAEAVAAAVVA